MRSVVTGVDSLAVRAAEQLRHLGLAVTTALSMAREDPALLVVHASRRLPRRWSEQFARALRRIGRHPGSAATAIGLWLEGRRAEARVAVRGALAHRPSPIVSEVAMELDALDGTTTSAPAATAARAAWRRGDVSGAIAATPLGSALRTRLVAERSLMATGTSLGESRTTRSPRAAGTPSSLHLLTNSLPHTTSGYALRSHAVLQAQQASGVRAAAVTRLGYPVSVGLVRSRDVEVVEGVAYHRLLPWRAAPTPDARLRQQVSMTSRLVDEYHPNVLHTTTPFGNALVAEAVASQAGLPWVYEVRGLLEETWAASFPTPEARAKARTSERHRLLRAREAELAGRADRVIVLGETVRDDLVARGVPAGAIVVVPNAVDASLLTVERAPAHARQALGLPSEGFWVGTIGSLVDYEGAATLLDAVAILRARGVDVRVAVVGDGVCRPALQRQIADRGLSGHAVLPGRVDGHRVIDWYLALDAFAVPRQDTTVTRMVTPLKPMQAMALGRPVIASDLPALDEIVGRPGAGILVPPDDPSALADGIAGLMDDGALAGQLGSAGRDFAATRTWSKVGALYRALYDGLAG